MQVVVQTAAQVAVLAGFVHEHALLPTKDVLSLPALQVYLDVQQVQVVVPHCHKDVHQVAAVHTGVVALRANVAGTEVVDKTVVDVYTAEPQAPAVGTLWSQAPDEFALAKAPEDQNALTMAEWLGHRHLRPGPHLNPKPFS